MLTCLSYALATAVNLTYGDEEASVNRLVQAANEAIQRGERDKGLALYSKAIQAAPNKLEYRHARAQLYDMGRQFRKAIVDCDYILERSLGNIKLLQLRGGARFKSGDIAGSIADFDAVIERAPDMEKQLWQRGISYYYAGEFAKGARQFELYQTYYGNDVENVVWRLLCQAKEIGFEKALQEIMSLDGPDSRVYMMEIYDMYRGKKTPDEVFAAIRKGEPGKAKLKIRLFYVHLYTALYHEARGQVEPMQKHILEAERREIPHYMWDVAHVHAQRLRARRAETED